VSRFDPLLVQSLRAGLDYEFWPAERPDSKKLLIVLHGRGDTLEGFQWLPEQLGIEEFNYLFLQAPDAFSFGYSWYDVAPNQGPGVIRSRELLFWLLDRLQAEMGLRSEDIFLFGFSQGCLMAIDVSLRYPKILGGVVGISGYVFFEDEYPQAFSKHARDQKIWVSHGHQDDVLAFDKTKISIERLRSLGLHIDWTAFDKAHTVDEREELPQIHAFFRRLLDAC
jgi:phospholipase/carboxylesterase